MLYSEFLKGTRAPETPDTYDQFQIIERIYTDCEGMTKEEAYRIWKQTYKRNRYGNVGGYECGYPGRNQSYYRTGYGKRTGSRFYTAAITNTFDRSYDVNNGRFRTGDDRY